MDGKTFGQKIFNSKLYPRLPQAITMYIFFYVIFALLWGPDNVGRNFGLVSIWILWWPLIPLTFVLLGRVWCTLCPWGAITDWMQSHFCLGLKIPKWIKKHGIWIIFSGFIFLTWYELALGVTSSRIVTAAILLTILVLAFVAGALFEKRVWCRYLCPLGGIFGNYAQTAVVEFRGTPEKCAQCKDAHCLVGTELTPGCTLKEFPKNMESNRLCNICGDCVKSCNNNSPKLTLRLPGKELWEKRVAKLDEALLSSLLVGIILISGIGMLELWVNLQKNLSTTTGLSKPLITTFALILFGLASFGLAYLASYFSSKSTKISVTQNFKIFGYALIPLNLMTHMAHNLFHFLGEGRNIVEAANVFFFTSQAQAAEINAKQVEHTTSSALASASVIQSLQFVFMFAGFAASAYVAWRIAKKMASSVDNKKFMHIFVPHIFVITIFSAVSLFMFILPMATRH